MRSGEAERERAGPHLSHEEAAESCLPGKGPPGGCTCNDGGGTARVDASLILALPCWDSLLFWCCLQVEGCTLLLGSSKSYFLRQKICGEHVLGC